MIPLARPIKAGDWTYSYEGPQNQVSIKRGMEELTYGYDPLGRLVTLARGKSISQLTYQADGLLGRIEAPGFRADYMWPRAPIPQRLAEFTFSKIPGEGKEDFRSSAIGMPDIHLGIPSAPFQPNIVWPNANPLLKQSMGGAFVTGVRDEAIGEMAKRAITSIPETTIQMFPEIFHSTLYPPAVVQGISESWGGVVKNIAPFVSTAWSYREELGKKLARRVAPEYSRGIAGIRY